MHDRSQTFVQARRLVEGEEGHHGSESQPACLVAMPLRMQGAGQECHQSALQDQESTRSGGNIPFRAHPEQRVEPPDIFIAPSMLHQKDHALHEYQEHNKAE